MADSFFRRLGLGLCLVMVAGLGAEFLAIASARVRADSAPWPGLVTTQGRSLVRDGARFELRGMNYSPKDHAWDRFWRNYETAAAQIGAELDRAGALGINTVRVFLPYDRFGGPTPDLDHLRDFVHQLERRQMVGIFTLFDFYPSHSPAPYAPSDYVSSTHHISTVVHALGITNTAVLAWDLKNELDRDYDAFGKAKVRAWANQMISTTRQLDPNHLITLGFYGVVTNTREYSPSIAAEFAHAVDFVSLHYFLSERTFERDLQRLRAEIGDKPIVLEEFGLHTLADPAINCDITPADPKCDDPHTEEEQAAYYNVLLSLSEAHGLAGYAFWTLNDFSYIVTETQQSHHCQGILRNSLVDVCQVTTTIDYAPKPAAGTVRRHFDACIAYLDLFDGWVDPNTDEPPAGWDDDWQQGGVLMRGYNRSRLLWSQDEGKVALAKFVSDTISITGTAVSAPLTGLDVDRHPILAGEVYSYSIRDRQAGSDATLHVGVREGTRITSLWTAGPGDPLPRRFALDLRQPPLGWTGLHTFEVVLQLAPVPPHDGYSAAYELDWLALKCAPVYLPLVLKGF